MAVLDQKINRMKRNLERDFGLKVFFIDFPRLAIRVPETDIEDLSEAGANILLDKLRKNQNQLRFEEIPYAYIIADESYKTIKIEDLMEILKIDPKSKEKPPPSINKIMEEMSSPTKRSTLFTRVVSGRRAEVLHKSKRGRYVKYREASGKLVDLAVAPTIRAAALRQAGRGKLVIKKIDLREKIRRRKISTLINIILDTSGSMIEKRKVEVTSKVIIELLKDAYQRRDKVALTTYSGRDADVPLPFTSSVELAKGFMENVSFGGTTPLSAGMLTGLNIILSEMMKGLVAIPLMVLITDGVANVPLEVGGNIERELQLLIHDPAP